MTSLPTRLIQTAIAALILSAFAVSMANGSGDPVTRAASIFRMSAYPHLSLGIFALATAVAWALLRRRDLRLSRRHGTIAIIAWIVVASLDWWILGPHSYSYTTYELAAATPIHQYAAALPPGTRYAHAFAGGTDLFALGHYVGQYVLIERLLVTWLPTWLGLAVHKILILGLTMAGTYLLCRRAGKTRRELAFAMAALATMAGDFQLQITFQLGQSFAILPLGIYLVVIRQERRWYWSGVAAYAAYAAATAAMPQGAMAVLGNLVLASLAIHPSRLVRAIPAILVIAVAMVINNSETIAGIMAVAPFTGNGVAGAANRLIYGFTDNLIRYAELTWFTSPGVMLTFLAITVTVAGLGGAAWKGFPGRSLVIALLLPALLGGLDRVPWSSVGLSIIGAISFTYVAFGFPSLCTLAVAALGRIEGRAWPAPRQTALTTVILALACGQLAYYAMNQKATWLATGGLGSYAIEDLRGRDWPKGQPFRVAASHYRIPENIPLIAGLDIATASFALEPLVISRYWAALTGHDPDATLGFGGNVGPSLRAAMDEPTARCCLSYDPARLGIDLDLLGAENVRFLISRVPFETLRLVSGPPEGTVPPRNGMAFSERFKLGLRYILDPPPFYIYELPRWLPRVFAPKRMETVAADQNWKTFLARVKTEVWNETAVVWDSERPVCAAGPLQPARIVATRLTGDGFEIDVEGTAGPGVAVFNAVYMPFWKAAADGTPTEAFPVNGIHTALCVPAGTHHLSLRWDRPLLREKLAARLGLGG